MRGKKEPDTAKIKRGKQDTYLPDDDFELIRLLSTTRDLIYKTRQKELTRYRTNVIRSSLLRTVYSLGSYATPKEIGRLNTRERHTTRELLVKLEREGLIRRINDLEKKNMIRVVLTKKGEDKYRQTRKAESLKTILSFLTKNEKKQLELILQKLRTGVTAWGKRLPER